MKTSKTNYRHSPISEHDTILIPWIILLVQEEGRMKVSRKIILGRYTLITVLECMQKTKYLSSNADQIITCINSYKSNKVSSHDV